MKAEHCQKYITMLTEFLDRTDVECEWDSRNLREHLGSAGGRVPVVAQIHEDEAEDMSVVNVSDVILARADIETTPGQRFWVGEVVGTCYRTLQDPPEGPDALSKSGDLWYFIW